MTALYPLRFKPIFRRYVWGGRKLATHLSKPIGDEESCAESWEICDRGTDQSIVAEGALAGWSLAEIVAQYSQELFGRHAPQSRFPLLLKFLDARHKLSVQVHPDDARAAQLSPPDLGKTEAWYVVDADPGSMIYAGLKRGFDRPALEREIARGTSELCLHRFEPRAGDCVFVPAGVVHALGEGLLVAEIQQSSDTTYRLFDWNRVGTDGQPRPLHIDAALEAIDYAAGPVSPARPTETGESQRERLIACDLFVVDRLTLDVGCTLASDNRFHMLLPVAGSIDVSGDPAGAPLNVGGSMLVPAARGSTQLIPRRSAVVLDIYLP